MYHPSGGFSSLPQRVQALFTVGTLFLIIECIALTIYRKWGAMWGPVPVLLAAPFVILPGLGVLTWVGLFRRNRSVSRFILSIWAIYSFLTLLAGSWLMEPRRETVVVQQPYSSYNSQVHSSRAYEYYGGLLDAIWGEDVVDSPNGVDGTSGSSTDTDSSGSRNWSGIFDDLDGDAAIFILVIATIIVYTVGAFFVPNFWIVSAMLGWVVFYLLAWKEYKAFKEMEEPSPRRNARFS